MIWLFIIVLIDSIGFGIILPLLPIFAIKFHLNAFELGVLMAVFSFFQLLVSPILGALSDKFGRKKIIIPCLFFIGLSYILLANAHTFWLAFLARSLAGIFTGNISVVLASVSDLSNDKNRAKYMGYIGAGTGLGFVLGPSIGGFLAGNNIEEANLQLVFYLASIFAIFAAICATFFLKETLTIKSSRLDLHFFTKLKRVTNLIIYNAQIMFLLYLSILMWAAFSSVNVFLTTWSVIQFHLNPQDLGLIGTIFGLIAAMMQVLSPYVIQGSKALFLGFIISAFSILLVVIFPPNITLLIIIVLLLSSGIGILYPNLNSTISLYGSSQQKGYILGLSQSASTIGQTIGPIIIGLLYDIISAKVAFISIALIFITASLITLLYMTHNRSIATK